MHKRIIAALTVSAALTAFALPAFADSPLHGSWKLIRADPPLPRVFHPVSAIVIAIRARHPYPDPDSTYNLDGRYEFSIYGACNGSTRPMEISQGRPNLASIGIGTQMICPDARGDFDKALTRALFSAQTIERDHDRLIFTGEAARLVFERLP